jgi:hypothetical protein
VERTTRKREVVVFTWGNPDDCRLGGVDLERHYKPQENLKLTALQARKRIEVQRHTDAQHANIEQLPMSRPFLLPQTDQAGGGRRDT